VKYYQFVKYSVNTYTDMIFIASVTNAYMLGENDETHCIRENVFGVSM
jgi:hypothetical protein